MSSPSSSTTTLLRRNPDNDSISSVEDHELEQEEPPNAVEPLQAEGNESPPLPERPKPVNQTWTNLTEGFLHLRIRNFNVTLGTTAARYPKACILLITMLSFGLVALGFATNFKIEFNHDKLFTPLHSRPAKHGKWVFEESNFIEYSDFILVVHAEGEDVLVVDAIRRMFAALDVARQMPGYEELCAQSQYLNKTNQPDCYLWSPTNFWNHNVTEFEETVTTNQDVQRILSQPRYQDGTPAFQELLFGKFKAVNETAVYNPYADKIFYYPHKHDYLVYVPAYFVSIGFPEIDETWSVQEKLLAVVQELQNHWRQQSPQENPHNIQLEFYCSYAYELEFARALYKDFPLIPAIFFVMLGTYNMEKAW